MAVTHRGVRFGAAYYHEYHRPGEDPSLDRLKTDLDLMADAGFTVIRVGESVWSTWEPEEGHFDLDWLEPVLDGAHERGIEAVLGTPTYAVPPWLIRRYPEIAGESATGHRLGWGARQEADFTHPAFRFYGARVLRMIVDRYRDHPAVTGYQVDNEPGPHLLHNHGVFQRFADELRREYGDVEKLNRAWGLTYWSHRLSTWADLWTPDGNAQPQYDLAWRRFQASLTTEMIDWQAQAVRELARPGQWVTTCISYDRPAIDDVALGSVLDVVAGNPYYGMQDDLAHPGREIENNEGPVQDWTVHGTWALFQEADHMWSSRGEEFLVTETNAQGIGHSHQNHPPFPGQLRQAAWALVARGARMVEYWHWHTLHYGAETYWGGVLPHNGRPGRVYREVAGLGREFVEAGEHLAGSTPEADIGILYGQDARFALAFQPPLVQADGSADDRSYPRIVSAFYRGAFDAGLQVRVLRPAAAFEREAAEVARELPVLIAAAWYPASDADLTWLSQYAAAGGHLVLGPRTGYADEEGRARTDLQPGGLARVAGAWYEEFSNLDAPVAVVTSDEGSGHGLVLSGAVATAWVECLVPGLPQAVHPGVEPAEVLARYEHPYLGEFAAVTSRAHGQGRVTVVGTVPGRVMARQLAAWVVPDPVAGWKDLPSSVTAHTATREKGTRIHILHNWAWKPVEVVAPADLEVFSRGAADGAPPADADTRTRAVAQGDRILLGAWDVIVSLERSRES